MKNQPTLLAALLLALTACGDDFKQEPSLTLEQTLAASEADQTARLCEVVFSCGATGLDPRVPTWVRRYPDEETCLNSRPEAARFDLARRATSLYIEEGRMRFDGVAAASCVAAIDAQRAARGCEAFFDTFTDEDGPEPCSRVFVGLRELGQPCDSSDECASGACDDPNNSCSGVCIAATAAPTDPCDPDPCAAGEACVDRDGAAACLTPKAIGQDCLDGSPCVAGASCEFNVESLTATCVAQPPPMTQDPTISASGKPCVQGGSPICAAGLTCTDGKLDATSGELRGRCSPPLTVGAPCYRDDECRADLRCADVSLGKAGSCAGLRIAGEPCESNDECASRLCGANNAGRVACRDFAELNFSCPLTPATM